MDSETILYQIWLKKHKVLSINAESFLYKPLISVILTIFDAKKLYFKRAIKSIINQTYPNFEIILVCNSLVNFKMVQHIAKRLSKGKKIVAIKEFNSLSYCLNSALEIAKGEFITFINCEDEIDENALALCVQELNKNKNFNLIYSDEDKISLNSKIRFSPFFKPDWSKETFLSINYIEHLCLYKTSIIRKIGCFDKHYNKYPFYDFALRYIDVIDDTTISHISYVLYHQRDKYEDNPTPSTPSRTNLDEIIKCKEEYLKRNNINGKICFDKERQYCYPVYNVIGNPLVSIIIPSKNNFILLKKCIESILKYTDYKNYELIVVDNGSNLDQKEKIENYLSNNTVKTKYIYKSMSFNYSKMINIGIKESLGSYLVTLNDDIEICTNSWLRIMLGQCQQQNIGIVGSKLLYNSKKNIQHIGMFISKGNIRHEFTMFPDTKSCYYGINLIPINCLCVTGACIIFSKSLVNKIGLFDENLEVTFNDVDYCLRTFESGLRNVCRNDIFSYHYESYSRGHDDESVEKSKRAELEFRILKDKHINLIKEDPYLNCSISRYDLLFLDELTKQELNYYKFCKFILNKGKLKKVIKFIRTRILKI